MMTNAYHLILLVLAIQPKDDNGKSRVVTDEQTSDDSPPLGSIGGQRKRIQPLISSSSPNLADS